MDWLINIIVVAFWGLLLLSVLVCIHEWGHFIAARIQGVRVTEFFLGLPSRARLSVRSKKYGTRYGVTPILLGGYTQICGMAGDTNEHLAPVLSYIMEHGRANVSQMAYELEIPEDKAFETCAALTDWASIEGYYDPELGEHEGQAEYPEAFQTVARDANMLTIYDKRHDFSLPGSTKAGEVQKTDLTPEEFLKKERSHTYQGRGFWGRILMLAAGVAINIFAGFLLVALVLMLSGVTVASNTNVVSAVSPDSLAAQAGLEAGDAIVSVDGAPTSTWQDVTAELGPYLEDGTDFTVTYTHDGQEHTTDVHMNGTPADQFGITASTEQMRLNPIDAIQTSGAYIGRTASYIAQLFQPAKAAQVIESSTSVVGIAVIASEAAQTSLASFAMVAAAVSLSLGFMNLLPIPPLDGGKMVIEVVQVAIRRPVSMKVQSAISIAGTALFMFLFFVLLRQDIMRFVVG